MGDVGDDYRAMNEAAAEKRKSNREHSTAMLIRAEIKFESKNGGAHLIVGEYDFWPSTGLFMNRKTKQRGRGIVKLIKKLRSNI